MICFKSEKKIKNYYIIRCLFKKFFEASVFFSICSNQSLEILTNYLKTNNNNSNEKKIIK